MLLVVAAVDSEVAAEVVVIVEVSEAVVVAAVTAVDSVEAAVVAVALVEVVEAASEEAAEALHVVVVHQEAVVDVAAVPAELVPRRSLSSLTDTPACSSLAAEMTTCS